MKRITPTRAEWFVTVPEIGTTITWPDGSLQFISHKKKLSLKMPEEIERMSDWPNGENQKAKKKFFTNISEEEAQKLWDELEPPKKKLKHN